VRDEEEDQAEVKMEQRGREGGRAGMEKLKMTTTAASLHLAPFSYPHTNVDVCIHMHKKKKMSPGNIRSLPLLLTPTFPMNDTSQLGTSSGRHVRLPTAGEEGGPQNEGEDGIRSRRTSLVRKMTRTLSRVLTPVCREGRREGGREGGRVGGWLRIQALLGRSMHTRWQEED